MSGPVVRLLALSGTIAKLTEKHVRHLAGRMRQSPGDGSYTDTLELQHEELNVEVRITVTIPKEYQA